MREAELLVLHPVARDTRGLSRCVCVRDNHIICVHFTSDYLNINSMHMIPPSRQWL